MGKSFLMVCVWFFSSFIGALAWIGTVCSISYNDYKFSSLGITLMLAIACTFISTISYREYFGEWYWESKKYHGTE
jgi:hypothetical protein